MLQYLEAGRLLSPHGVRGELKMEVWGDDLRMLKQSGRVFFSPQGGTFRKIVSIRPAEKGPIVRLEGVEDMDTARTFTNRVIYISREDVKLPEGHYFLQDLVGCAVIDANSGREYGIVESVDHPGAQDIFTVKTEAGEVCYLPDVPAFVQKKIPSEGKILVTPIPGLFTEAENGDGEVRAK